MVVRRLVDNSADVQAAILLDAAGTPIASSDDDTGRTRELADLARRLVETADGATDEPIEQVEVQAAGGSAFAVRSPRHVLACVASRAALPALVLYDLRHALLELERPA
ncbi:MAG: roadblock/LC7 domain-containing protein [Thermoleophilaceae bacterium]